MSDNENRKKQFAVKFHNNPTSGKNGIFYVDSQNIGPGRWV